MVVGVTSAPKTDESESDGASTPDGLGVAVVLLPKTEPVVPEVPDEVVPPEAARVGVGVEVDEEDPPYEGALQLESFGLDGSRQSPLIQFKPGAHSLLFPQAALQTR